MVRKSMLRGFVHEMSNALTSHMLVLASVLKEGSTLCQHNAIALQEVFELIAPDLSPDLRDRVIAYFTRIEQNEEALDRVLTLLNDTTDRAIDRTKLVAEYARLEYQPVNIQSILWPQVIEAVLQRDQSQFTQQQIVVTCSGNVQAPIAGHLPHFLLMFEHLFRNACQAFVEVVDDRERMIDITIAETPEHQQISIRDTAKGIADDQMDEIFEPFYTTSPKTRAGLGLNVVLKLLDMYAGTFDIASTPGQGTTVTLTFPLHPSIPPLDAFEHDA